MSYYLNVGSLTTNGYAITGLMTQVLEGAAADSVHRSGVISGGLPVYSVRPLRV